MPKRDFNAALKGLDADMSENANRRLRERLAGGPGRPRRVRWGRVSGVGAVIAMALAVVVSLRPQSSVDSLGGFTVAQRSAELTATASVDTVTLTSGRCTLRDEALGSAMQVAAPARLRRLADGVELAAGTVSFDVDHLRARPGPFRVRVSHGSIEVLGTQFIVTQRTGGGEVTLQRGSIQFRADDGQVRLLTPGQSLSWPLLVPEPQPQPQPQPGPEPIRKPLGVEPPPQRPSVSTPPTQPPLAEEKPFDTGALLDRVAVLRSRGQYEAAVAVLGDALTERHAPSSDERLSFELGAILTRQLQDAPRACAHWQAHRARFDGGRYEAEIAQARATLGCGQP